jgi:hypothetical protein
MRILLYREVPVFSKFTHKSLGKSYFSFLYVFPLSGVPLVPPTAPLPGGFLPASLPLRGFRPAWIRAAQDLRRAGHDGVPAGRARAATSDGVQGRAHSAFAGVARPRVEDQEVARRGPRRRRRKRAEAAQRGVGPTRGVGPAGAARTPELHPPTLMTSFCPSSSPFDPQKGLPVSYSTSPAASMASSRRNRAPRAPPLLQIHVKDLVQQLKQVQGVFCTIIHSYV